MVSQTWLTKNPGAQLLTGSFHPVDDDAWDDRRSWHVDALRTGDTLESLFYLLALQKQQRAPAALVTLLSTFGVSFNVNVSTIICQVQPSVGLFGVWMLARCSQYLQYGDLDSFLSDPPQAALHNGNTAKRPVSSDSWLRCPDVELAQLSRTWDAFLPRPYAGDFNAVCGDFEIVREPALVPIVITPFKVRGSLGVL